MNRHWNSYLNRTLSRRDLLRVSSTGFGSLALAGLLAQEEARAAAGTAAPGPLAVKAPHFTARAKRVIFLFMFQLTAIPIPAANPANGAGRMEWFQHDKLVLCPINT